MRNVKRFELYEVRGHGSGGSYSMLFFSEQSARKYVGMPNKYENRVYKGKLKLKRGFVGHHIGIFEEDDQVKIIGTYIGRSKADGRDMFHGFTELDLWEYVKREKELCAMVM
jgi:hypothetical protein